MRLPDVITEFTIYNCEPDPAANKAQNRTRIIAFSIANNLMNIAIPSNNKITLKNRLLIGFLPNFGTLKSTMPTQILII